MIASALLFVRGLNWGKLLIKALPVLAVLAALWGVYHLGSNHREAVVRARWDKAQKQELANIAKLNAKILKHEAAHRAESQRITDDLAQADQIHASNIASIRAQSAVRLRNSEQRGAYYLTLSKTGPTECGNVASHAAKLDKSLEEGRQLVEEFRSTLEQRDAQLRALGQQILADRKLTGENDGQNAPATQ